MVRRKNSNRGIRRFDNWRRLVEGERSECLALKLIESILRRGICDGLVHQSKINDLPR